MRNPVASLIAVLLLLISGPALAAAPTKDDMDLSPAAAANNAFALDLYAKLRGASGNIFLSPYSISTALAMTSVGARGQTEAEMINTLHLSSLPPAQRHAILGALIQRYQADRAEKGYELHVADALWLAKGFSILPGFSNIAQTHYVAQTAEVDFHHSSEAAATINNWVSAHTNDKIKDLIPASALNDLTCLVLTNAVYFKGEWKTPFQPRATYDDVWHSPAGDKNVPMMHSQTDNGFYEDGSLSALSIPYAGDDLEMLVLLPKKLDGIGELEASLDTKRLAEISSQISTREVIVTLPKYRMDSTFDLVPALKEMGMTSAFNAADFSGIDGRHDLYISGVIHKAYVDADEKGTEAAGATGIIVRALMARPSPPVFNADHPFLFLIRDVKDQTILFMGRVSKL
jgi:serpin B